RARRCIAWPRSSAPVVTSRRTARRSSSSSRATPRAASPNPRAQTSRLWTPPTPARPSALRMRPRIVLITDPRYEDDALAAKLDAALAVAPPGFVAVQLRDKARPTGKLLPLAR